MNVLPDFTPSGRGRPNVIQKGAQLLCATLGLLAALATPAPAEAATSPAKQALAEFYGSKSEKNVIQNKFFLKANRFEIAPSFGYIPNNAFVSNYYGGALLAYHFSETFAAEGAFLYAPNSGESGVKNLTKTLVAIAYESNNQTTFRQPLDRLQLGAIFSARFAPVYGKINLIGEGVLNFDVYGTAGIGLLLVTKDYASVNEEWKTQQDNPEISPVSVDPSAATVANPALNLGIGMDFFLTQSIALKIDARSALYIAEEPNYGNKLPNGDPAPLESQVYNTFMTTAGVSIYVPRMKPRMFNF
ncbi:MAG: outer membrane beta-barrel domain-containing protein [Myxococcota bacterium]